MKLNCFIKQPGGKPYHTAISDSLTNLQNAVGGHVELVHLSNGTVALCDEEARFKISGHCCEIDGRAFYGTVVFLGIKHGTEEDTLTDHPAKTLKQFEAETEIYY